VPVPLGVRRVLEHPRHRLRVPEIDLADAFLVGWCERGDGGDAPVYEDAELGVVKPIGHRMRRKRLERGVVAHASGLLLTAPRLQESWLRHSRLVEQRRLRTENSSGRPSRRRQKKAAPQGERWFL